MTKYLIALLGLVGYLAVGAHFTEKVSPTWCKEPGVMSYWQSPMPPEYKHRVRMYTASALREGCFDGHHWSSEEILKALPL